MSARLGMTPADAADTAAPAAAAHRRTALHERFTRWWQQRLPRADAWRLTQRNIYILPTRAGFAFALTLVLMLLASINYQLNLGFALTFLLAGAGVVSMHLTHATLRGLTLHLRPPAAVFAGDAAGLEVVITNPGAARHGLALHVDHGAAARAGSSWSPAWTDVPARGQESVHLSLVPPRRGWHTVPTIVVQTQFPFGLFRAWTIWRPAARVLAWPRPEPGAPPLPRDSDTGGEMASARRGAGGELDGVRPFRRGDTLRQVVWKKVARSGELVSRETASNASRRLWLDWSAAAGAGGGASGTSGHGGHSDSAAAAGSTEARLSRLAAWVLAAEREGLDYGLRLGGSELPPAQGDAQRRAALELLALWP